jgi:hypothetical protein
MASVLLGAVPATGFLRQSGIGLDSRGFIPVNKVGLDEVGRMRGGAWLDDHVSSPVPPTEPWPSPHR